MKDSAELIRILEQHEKLLVFSTFDSDTAWELGSAAREAFLTSPAYKDGKGVVIAVELFNGHTLFRASVGNGVTADNWTWVARKFASVRRFERSSFLLGRQQHVNNRSLASTFALDEKEYADHGGAIPIRIKGVSSPVGAMIVSGLPQDQDHELAAQIMAQHLKVNVLSVLE